MMTSFITSAISRRILNNHQFRSLALRSRRRRPGISELYKEDGEIRSTPKNKIDPETAKQERMKLFDNTSNNLFVARDKDGKEISMEEYLKFASLSPWVPCPEPAVRKILEITRMGSDDVHYELGSGDGRVNFHAIDLPSSVKKSVGVDIDPNLVQSANNRIQKRHPKPDNIEFQCIDLLGDKPETQHLWETIQKECTILTMYFVEDALQQLKPKFEKYLSGTGVKIVMVGYEIKQWEPRWHERVLDLPIHMYVMDENFEERNDSSNSNIDFLSSAHRNKMPPIPVQDIQEYDEPTISEDDDWVLDHSKDYHGPDDDDSGDDKRTKVVD